MSPTVEILRLAQAGLGHEDIVAQLRLRGIVCSPRDVWELVKESERIRVESEKWKTTATTRR